MKILSIKELKDTMWPEWLKDAMGENIVSAFLHGDCLMEGFDPFKESWLISFWLKDNSPAKIQPLQDLLRQAEKHKVKFGYFFTDDFFETAADVFPLEFLHISNRNEPIIGEKPLVGFTPDKKALRLQCERELRGILVHLHGQYVYRLRGKTSIDFFLEAERTLLPILYGIRYLETGSYPESRDSVYDVYPFLKIAPPGEQESTVSERAESYILEVEKILNYIDKMEV